jgi:hypothetical protein
MIEDGGLGRLVAEKWPEALGLLQVWEAYPEAFNLRACVAYYGRNPPIDPAASADDMREVLEILPDLTLTGFGLEGKYVGGRWVRPVCPEAFQAQRDAMFLSEVLSAFEDGREWLRPYRKARACRVSARGLKHDAAKDIDYVTTGLFIAAAFAESFKVKRWRIGSDGLINVDKNELLANDLRRLRREHPGVTMGGPRCRQ